MVPNLHTCFGTGARTGTLHTHMCAPPPQLIFLKTKANSQGEDVLKWWRNCHAPLWVQKHENTHSDPITRSWDQTQLEPRPGYNQEPGTGVLASTTIRFSNHKPALSVALFWRQGLTLWPRLASDPPLNNSDVIPPDLPRIQEEGIVTANWSLWVSKILKARSILELCFPKSSRKMTAYRWLEKWTLKKKTAFLPYQQ